jgi:hypothetical protein
MLDDARLIALWDRWKRSFADEALWETGHAAARTRAIEHAIAETPAEGLDGIAIKLALWAFINRHDDDAALQANSALRDMTRFIPPPFNVGARARLGLLSLRLPARRVLLRCG